MLSVRVIAPAPLASAALEILSGAAHLSSLAHYPGASIVAMVMKARKIGVRAVCS